jgi:hypothetical protein
MAFPGLLASSSSAALCGGLGGGGVIIRKNGAGAGGCVGLALQLRRKGAATMSQVMSPASPSHSQMHIRGPAGLALPSTDSRLRSGT